MRETKEERKITMIALKGIVLIPIIIVIIAVVALIVVLATRSGKNRTTPPAYNMYNTKMCPVCRAICHINQQFCNNCGNNFMQGNFNPNQPMQQNPQPIYQNQQQNPQQWQQNQQQGQQ